MSSARPCRRHAAGETISLPFRISHHASSASARPSLGQAAGPFRTRLRPSALISISPDRRQRDRKGRCLAIERDEQNRRCPTAPPCLSGRLQRGAGAGRTQGRPDRRAAILIAVLLIGHLAKPCARSQQVLQLAARLHRHTPKWQLPAGETDRPRGGTAASKCGILVAVAVTLQQ